MFATIYTITSRFDRRYPCAAADAGPENEEALVRAFGRAPGARANDGAVPLRSQIWGKLVWAGYGDHLDVLGHFRDAAVETPRTAKALDDDPPHVDWLYSRSGFGRAEFASLMDTIVEGILAASPT